MAQLRQDYDAFVERGTEVIAVGPDTKKAFQNFWEEKNMPFIGLADPNHKVAGKYEQEVNLLKLGRMPAQIIIDKKGIVRYVHYSNSMSDITENEEILEILDEIEE
jgi:peroxiredoxin Q/BCP